MIISKKSFFLITNLFFTFTAKVFLCIISLLIATAIGSPTYLNEESGSYCSEGQFTPHESNCNQFYVCSNSELSPRSCPAGLHFNAEQQICDYPYSANCEEEEFEANDCPRNEGQWYLGHPNCEKFYSCSYGVPYEQRCSYGLHWHVDNKVCDWKDNANCVEGASPEQPGAVLLPGGEISTLKPNPSEEETDSVESF